MKKRIALFANGWSSDFIQDLGKGMSDIADSNDIDFDIYAFINYSRFAEAEENQIGEYTIFSLPKFEDFDGAVVLANTFNLKKELDYIQAEILKTDTPVVSLEYKLDGADYLGSDDYSGMYELTEHLIVSHNVKKVMFIGGIADHLESNTRKRAVADALKANGLELSEDNVLYGFFAAGIAIEQFKNWFENNGYLPDAIVCANDTMALGISKHLSGMGYAIPDDIIVTGFDALPEARKFAPSITSVSRDWINMGRTCMEILLSRINGQPAHYCQEVPTKVVYGGSCGCDDELTDNMVQRGVAKRRISDSFEFDQHFRHLYLSMRKSDSAEYLNNRLSDYFLNEGWLEGDEIMIAFHSGFFVSESLGDIRLDSYDGDVNIVCHIHDKKREPITCSSIRDAIFGIGLEKKGPQTYIFVPIRVDDFCVGFASFTRGFDILEEAVLYRWCRHMGQYVELVKSNVQIKQLTRRLENLSVTDALTGVYNRTGCESIMYPALATNQQSDGCGLLMIADVDKLKYINDNFGHDSGDLAIKFTVDALQKALPKDFMIGRYGGDEFLVVGCVSEPVDIDAITKQIDDSIAQIGKANNLKFELSVSVGIVQLEKGKFTDVLDYIKMADTNMYKVKFLHKNCPN